MFPHMRLMLKHVEHKVTMKSGLPIEDALMARAEEAKLRSLSSRKTAAAKIGPPIGQRLLIKSEKYFAIF